MDWDNLRHFAAFVAAGSLSGAARSLGVEHATTARRIAALEAHLALKLVDRRGRRLVLTEEGSRVAALAERMAAQTQAIARLADGARSELTGEVTISAPSAYAALVLAPRLVALRERHPGLVVDVLGEARTASLERREADLAVRLSRPEQGDLAAFRLDAMRFRLYADTAYLARTPEAAWRFIGARGPMAGSPQQAALEAFAAGRGFAFQADHAEMQLALAAAGGGVAMLPDFMAERHAGLVVARPDDPPLLRAVWLVVHADLRRAAPIRAVIEGLRRSTAPGPADEAEDDVRIAPKPDRRAR